MTVPYSRPRNRKTKMSQLCRFEKIKGSLENSLLIKCLGGAGVISLNHLI